jgi:hypothetical protein
MPVDGRELIAAWKLPAAAYDTETVKIARCIIGTHRIEMLQSLPIRDFSMPETAGGYGPGKYRISPGPGPYSDKSVTMEISEEYARREGWASAPPQPPPPSAVETMAARTFQQAQSGPVDPLSLTAMVEVAVQRALNQHQTPTADPFALLLKGFELANMFQTKSMEAAKTMLGVAAPAEAHATTFADVLLELGPKILEVIQSVAPAVIASANQQPAAVPAAPIQQLQVKKSGDQTMPAPAPREPVALPKMTEQEIKDTAPIIAILKPYAGILAQQLSRRPPEELADQLGGMIGADLWDSVLAFSDTVQKYGLSMMGHIGPGLSTPAAGIVVHTLAREILTYRETDWGSDTEVQE